RTGDPARRLTDGNVEYIGRVDRQLKIRGNRVEPGEIEYAMLAAPGISDACVVFREDILCGYYTSATAVEESFLRAYLSGELADYMVPGVLMRLDSFPLTGSGKKDVQALPSPLSFTDNLFRAPSGETEQQVAAVWAATLGREQIGATANFFSLGGDSIKAIQVMSRLRSQGYSVSMKNIFDYPTVEGLAQQVRKVTGEATQETITGRDSQGPPQFTYGELSQENIGNICKKYPVDDLYRLSGIQEGMLFHWLYDPHSNAYFQQFSYLLKGSIDRDRMWDTLHRLVEKHDSLRTVFLYKGLQQPVQAVLTTLPPLISFRDVSAQVVLEGKRKVVEQYRQADRRQPFVPDSGPLIRFALLQLATDQYELIWSFHHIIMDGWCINLLVKDFLDIYQQYGKLTAPETDTPQYKNYLNWLDKGNKEEMRSFWKAYFEGYSTNSSSILSAYADLPCGKEEQSCRHLVVSTEQSVQLKSLCRKMQLTPSMVIQALWGILLGKYGNCGDVVFGLVVSGRPPELPQADVIVGLFINTVPLRITFNNNMSFAALFEAVKKQAGDITLYQYTPLPEIREMISAGTAPMFDHTLVFEDFGYQLPADWKEAGFEMLAGELFEQTNYMLDVSVHTVNEISFKFTYDPSQLTDSLVKNLISDLSGLIDKVIENPQQPVGDFRAGNGSAEKHSNLFSDIRF
ncbi:condensation domain-containing protein, partial [Chitinophaga sp.]|uniref:condensation domain-containing protein n=1 Tax=Chitinophaga sp. TaxID=1869181 RepID=UPI002CCD7416